MFEFDTRPKPLSLLFGNEHPLTLPQLNLPRGDTITRANILAREGLRELKPGRTIESIIAKAPLTARHITIR